MKIRLLKSTFTTKTLNTAKIIDNHEIYLEIRIKKY